MSISVLPIPEMKTAPQSALISFSGWLLWTATMAFADGFCGQPQVEFSLVGALGLLGQPQFAPSFMG